MYTYIACSQKWDYLEGVSEPPSVNFKDIRNSVPTIVTDYFGYKIVGFIIRICIYSSHTSFTDSVHRGREIGRSGRYVFYISVIFEDGDFFSVSMHIRRIAAKYVMEFYGI